MGTEMLPLSLTPTFQPSDWVVVYTLSKKTGNGWDKPASNTGVRQLKYTIQKMTKACSLRRNSRLWMKEGHYCGSPVVLGHSLQTVSWNAIHFYVCELHLKLLLITHACLIYSVGTHAEPCPWRSEDNFVKLSLSCHLCTSPGDQFQVTGHVEQVPFHPSTISQALWTAGFF